MAYSNSTSQLAFAGEDIQHARHALAQTLKHLREQAQPWALSGVQRIVEDPYVIGKVGDLQIRLEVAAALHERAEAFFGEPAEHLVAVAEAVIAAADALQAVGNTQHELTGQRPVLPSSSAREPLRWQYQIIGNYRLNGVVPPQLQE